MKLTIFCNSDSNLITCDIINISLLFNSGSSKDMKDILPFQSIGTGGSCDHSNGQTCAAVSTDLLPWQLHALQTYYVAIKATDTVGMFVVAWSEQYQHSARKATAGIVYDIDIDADTTV
jgi:hypothetical protein